MSRCKLNFHGDCENTINRQINLELHAMYVYTSMAFHFERDDVHLKGLANFFCECAKRKFEHAQKLMKFQSERGGRVVFLDIKKPEKDEWGTGLDAMEIALAQEKAMNQAILDLRKLSDKHSDYHLSQFLDSEFVQVQVEAIRKVSGYVSELKRVGPGHGEYHFDSRI